MKKKCWKTRQRLDRTWLSCLRRVEKGNPFTEVRKVNELLKKQPWWKRRLESQVKELNKDLEKLNPLLEGKKMKKKQLDNLQKRHKLKEEGKPKVKEEILQRITLKKAKINNRCQQRVSQFRQNKFFRNNEGRFYFKQIDRSELGQRWQYLMHKKQKHFGQIFGTKKPNIIRMQLG